MWEYSLFEKGVFGTNTLDCLKLQEEWIQE